MEKRNQMTAMRFQTGVRHQTSPDSLQGMGGGGWGWMAITKWVNRLITEVHCPANCSGHISAEQDIKTQF